MSKEIIFTIGGGTVEVEAEGFKGGACEVATKAYEEALGGKVTGKKHKAEYYEKAPEVRLTAGNGN